MKNFINSLQSCSGILLLMLLIVVVILLVCVFNLSLGLNRLSRKYAIFMKGKDAQSLEKLFKRKFDLKAGGEFRDKLRKYYKAGKIAEYDAG